MAGHGRLLRRLRRRLVDRDRASDSKLDVVVIEAGSRVKLAQHAYGLRSGGIGEQEGVTKVRCSEAEVELEAWSRLERGRRADRVGHRDVPGRSRRGRGRRGMRPPWREPERSAARGRGLPRSGRQGSAGTSRTAFATAARARSATTWARRSRSTRPTSCAPPKRSAARRSPRARRSSSSSTATRSSRRSWRRSRARRRR